MHSRLYSYLEKFNIIYEGQFGFRQKLATIDALAELNERLRMCKDKKIKCSLFVDLKKAFDTLDMKILLSKLENYGIPDNCLAWFNSYLNNRFQCVQIND